MEFATSGTFLWGAIGVMVLAMPGLALARFGPWLPRSVAALVMLLLAFAILDPLRVEQVLTGQRLMLVPTDPQQSLQLPEALLNMKDTRENSLRVSVIDGSSQRLALVRARLEAALSTDPVAMALVWNGPLDTRSGARPGSPDPANGAPPLQAIVDPDPAPLDPERLVLSALRGFAASRPAAFEFTLPAQAPAGLEWHARLTVRDPAGHLVLDRVTETAPPAIWRVDWTPAAEGRHEVRLVVEIDSFLYEGQATLQVQAAATVLVVGDGEAWSRALQVQGLQVRSALGLVPDLTGIDVVLLAAPIPAADQQRLQEFVATGGGLMVFGGASGGAIPHAGESLAALLPVVRLPVPEPPGATGAGGTSAGPPEPALPDGEAPEQKTPPPPDTSDPPPSVDPAGQAAKGDTAGARLTEGPEVEVDRRNIAVVLLVDVSTSMGIKLGSEDARIEYAKKSAYETAAALSAGDMVGFVVFGDGARQVLGLTPATEREMIRDRIERVRANQDRTLIEEALRMAGRLLAQSKAAVRQIIMITDGEFADTHVLSGSRFPIFSHARELRESGITISMIMISDANNPDALEVAGQLTSPGAFVVSRRGGQVPRLVSAEVVRSLGSVGRTIAQDLEPGAEAPVPAATPRADEPPAEKDRPGQSVQEEKVAEADARSETAADQLPRPDPTLPTPARALIVRAITESPLLEPTPAPPGYPTLDDIVPVVARTEAHTLLVAGDQGIPLLSFGLAGTGRVAVFTSDVFGPMGARFGAEPDFPARLARWVSALLPPRLEELPPVLAGLACTPPAPTPAEMNALVELTGSPTLKSVDYRLPNPIFRSHTVGTARDLALPALVSLLLLAFAEWWRARR